LSESGQNCIRFYVLIMVEYHGSDFDLDEWAEEAGRKFSLPDIVEVPEPTLLGESSTFVSAAEEYNVKWDDFYNHHSSGQFFKPRRYLAVEFENYFNVLVKESLVVEVGCGHGCSMFPLVSSFPFHYVATDYSSEAVSILQADSKYNLDRCRSTLWDVTLPAPEDLRRLCCTNTWGQTCSDKSETDSQQLTSFSELIPMEFESTRNISVDAILCVFALSAVHPSLHVQSFMNMRDLLFLGSQQTADSSQEQEQQQQQHRKVILFRDYAIHDMTMYRHATRHGDWLFRRADGTLAYYFTEGHMRRVAAQAGLEVLECCYARVRTENRKAGSVMRRVFLHAVLALPLLTLTVPAPAPGPEPGQVPGPEPEPEPVLVPVGASCTGSATTATSAGTSKCNKCGTDGVGTNESL
jgi:hypothetical protein